jgi:4-amino-4-deoxy-L-arabinose transferase-like glycosyltransferase
MPLLVDGSRKGHLFGAFLIAVSVAAFLLLYWNRFLAGTVGGSFFYFGEQVLNGKVPYRDFFFVAPPLHGIKIAALLQLFGHTIVATRIEAVIDRISLAILLYLWIVRFARPANAFFGSLLAMVLFMGDWADSLSSYHQDAAFWAVASGAITSLALKSLSRRKALLCGILVGAYFLTKQTIGLGITVVLPVTFTHLPLERACAGSSSTKKNPALQSAD